MSLFKRKGSPYWWIKITHNGRAIQKSTRTADEVKALMSIFVKSMPQIVFYATNEKAHISVSLILWCARRDSNSLPLGS